MAAVARDVVGYLEGGRDEPGVALLTGDDSDGGGGVVAFHGDSAEGPGRWIGAGAAYHGLDGTVQPARFAVSVGGA